MKKHISSLYSYRSWLRWFSWGLVVLLLASGCKNENDDFGFVGEPPDEEESNSDSAELLPVEIVSYSPTDNPVRVTGSSHTTFVVEVNSGAGDELTYTFKLNGSVISSGTKPFFDLNGSLVPEGINTFEVVADNVISNASKIFSLEKNTPPTIDSTSPAPTGSVISCGSGTLQLQAQASDADADGLTFTWLLNGASHATYYSVTTLGGTSTNDFTPPCTLSGSNTVGVEVSDGYDSATYSWVVTVDNPSVAAIDAFTPVTTPVIIPSTGSQAFSVSASGKDPLSYEWRLNGTAIPGETSSFINVNGSSLSIGAHTLTAYVSDYDSNDSHDFQVIRNAPPALSNASPSTGTSKINYSSFLVFSIDASDANGDTLSYTWTLDGVPSATLADSITGSGSQAIFSPNAGLVGTHTVQVVASDGTETTPYGWTVTVNYFSDACNNLQAGQICTLVGDPGIGSGKDPTTDVKRVKIQPTYMVDDGSGNLFISDDMNHVVWFYNRSGSSKTVLNKVVPAGQIVAVVGNGASGTSSSGSANNNYKLYSPYGLAWDPVNEALFIANYNNHRVVRVTSDGVVSHVLCNGSTANNTANNTEGAAATAHSCRNPAGLAYDVANKRLYVAIYNNHSIKYFDVSDPDPANWTGHILVGRLNGSGATTAGSDNGPTGGGGGAARTNGPWDLSLDSNGVLHFSEYGGCRVRAANITGSSHSFFSGGRVVNNNSVLTLFGTGSCDVNTNDYTSLKVRRPRGLQVYEPSGVFTGWFVSNDDYDRITFVNNTAGDVTIGGRTVNSNKGHYIWGNGTAGFGGDISPAFTSLINYSWGMTMDTTHSTLFLADRSSFRVRTLDVSVADGALATIAGEAEKYGFSGGSNTPATDSILNNPVQMTYDSVTNAIFFSDFNNGRIRSVDVETGEENTIIGRGPGNGNIEQENPLDVYMRGPQGLFFFGDGIVFADRYNSNGTNRNCLVRVYNRGALAGTFWNRTVNSGKVATIAGDYALGCASWQGAFEGSQATNVSLYRPEGIASDGTNLFIANHQSHCILKVAADGSVTTFLGACNSAGNVDGTIGAASLRLRYPTTVISDPRYPQNLFIADQTDNNTSSRIKYVNQTGSDVTIAGVVISANAIGTLFSPPGRGYGVGAFDNQVCYTSGQFGYGGNGAHNVTCKNRDDPLGNTTMRAGPADGSSVKGGQQMDSEQEGASPTSATLYAPYGLAFDADGNLYISERSGHVIRMVKKWW